MSAAKKQSNFPYIYDLSPTLQSTACLLGLVNANERIDCIVFRMNMNPNDDVIDYVESVNKALVAKNYPPVYINADSSDDKPCEIYWNWYRSVQQLAKWGWSEKECRSLLEFSNIKLPKC